MENREWKLLLDVEIPVNTSATIYIPAKERKAITESGQPLSAIEGLAIKNKLPGFEIVKAGSGIYHFAVEKL